MNSILKIPDFSLNFKKKKKKNPKILHFKKIKNMFFFRAHSQVLKVFYAYFLKNNFYFYHVLKKIHNRLVYPNKFLKKSL